MSNQNSADKKVQQTKTSTLTSKFRLYTIRYRSFINSPRVCFIYDTFFYLVFLLLFSYMILCNFVYYVDDDNEDEVNFKNGSKSMFANSTHADLLSSEKEESQKQISAPSWMEWVLISWVLTFIIEEIRQVIFLSIFFKIKNAVIRFKIELKLNSLIRFNYNLELLKI